MTPDDYTIQELMLEVSDGHQLYVQDWGNKDVETPILFVHGGPGSNTQNKHRDLFDPLQQRVIFYDQRGCGRSTPYGSIEHNTTQDLVADIERIADKLNLEKFMISGGSWGSCLALAYTIEHPERVTAMVLRGILTGTQREISWIDHGHFKTFYPDVWDKYLSATPEKFRDDPSRYHFERILSGDTVAAKASAYAYQNMEGSLLNLDDRFQPNDYDDYDPAGCKIEIHYLANHCFLADNYILDNAAKLTMPIWLIEGRYDMVCPPMTAYQLDQKLPDSELIWIISGHKNEREGWTIERSLIKRATEET